MAVAEKIDGVQCAAGEFVVKAQHTNLVFSPHMKPRWYSENPHDVRVPLKQVLRTGIAMPLALSLPRGARGDKKKRAGEGLEKGARELSEEDHDLIMEELRARDVAADE